MSLSSPDPVGETIEQLAQVRANAMGRIGRHQKAIERVTHLIGQPRTIPLVLVFIAGWAGVNLALRVAGRAPFDAPPFPWLQGFVALAALVTSIMVLTTELRQTRHEEERAQLDLHVNLLAERKIAKLIALVEELRRDLPNVRNRLDPEAKALAQAIDPEAALEGLSESFEDP